jgi:2-polyprenyl-3-methyl-5-hydroxy-6-metoxy-1,4-benzoquinol methylase
MVANYDRIYRDAADALGAPTRQFVEFFDHFTTRHANVLDVGCGQGRDAVFIARLGHGVTALDLSPTGIAQLRKVAAKEGLEIRAEVADIRLYEPAGRFDVIVLDRTLHMLDRADRIAVLARMLACVAPGGHVLIADENSNMTDFEAVLDTSDDHWAITLKKSGLLFVSHSLL